MPQIIVDKPHTLGAKKAKKALIRTLDKQPGNWDVNLAWEEYTCRITGDGILGYIKIADDRIYVDVNISLLVRRATGMSSAEVQRLFAGIIDQAVA